MPNLAVVGQGLTEREERDSNERQQEDWMRWQSWYLGDTAVSMNVKSAWQAGYTGQGILVAVVDDGVDKDHPDLVQSFNSVASYDVLSDQNIYSTRNPDSHGTKCAGIIAGGNNSKCGVGIAFGAQISSIRLYSDSIRSTDPLEAKALSFKKDLIDIYSNSWGPGDRAFEVKGPGPLLEEVLEKGTRLGRGGKGSIFVFAAGNGGILGDSCAFSGYVNNIHTIAISGVNWDGSVPAYAEDCASIMAVTYGQDMFRYGKFVPPLVTTKGANDCTERFPGTSGTAAMASGIIALALQANKELTWRDVQHLIARSSKPLGRPVNPVSRPGTTWIKNGADLKVSKDYGFGLMDAMKMIEYAKKWQSVPRQLSCEIHLNISNNPGSDFSPLGDLRVTLHLKQDDCSIQYLEHMQAEVSLNFSRRGDLEMVSNSPSGTQSKLFYSRTIDSAAGFKTFKNLRVTSLHYWGENPIGRWNITIHNTRPRRNTGKGRLRGLKLIFYGTKDDPLSYNKHVDRRTKRTETVDTNRRERVIPIHGRYSQWSYWGLCSQRCGRGTQQRSRYCTNPRPKNGGRDCSSLGPERETRSCYRRRCPETQIHGGYSQWSSWGSCSQQCAGGVQQRSRSCTNPRPKNGGRNCNSLGPGRETRICNNHSCQACSDMNGGSNCQLYLNNGFCSNPTVKKMCRKTCGVCQACTNMGSDSNCQYYSNIGYCSNSSIKKMCRKTCGVCQA